MAITYTWSITGLKKAPSLNGLDDVVTGIRFKYKGVDSDGNEGVFDGAVPVGAPNSDSFIAISELTEAEIIEWAKANHPVDHMQEMIADSGHDHICDYCIHPVIYALCFMDP